MIKPSSMYSCFQVQRAVPFRTHPKGSTFVLGCSALSFSVWALRSISTRTVPGVHPGALGIRGVSIQGGIAPNVLDASFLASIISISTIQHLISQQICAEIVYQLSRKNSLNLRCKNFIEEHILDDRHWCRRASYSLRSWYVRRNAARVQVCLAIQGLWCFAKTGSRCE